MHIFTFLTNTAKSKSHWTQKIFLHYLSLTFSKFVNYTAKRFSLEKNTIFKIYSIFKAGGIDVRVER